MRLLARFAKAATWLAVFALASSTGGAQDTVDVTLPATVGFTITDVTANTVSDDNPTPVSFANGTYGNSLGLAISVKADGDFVPPSGPAIPADYVSWTTASASNGVGHDGTLNTSSYTLLFQGDAGAVSGSVDVNWTLQAPGTPLRAGIHTLTLRWKFEAVTP